MRDYWNDPATKLRTELYVVGIQPSADNEVIAANAGSWFSEMDANEKSSIIATMRSDDQRDDEGLLYAVKLREVEEWVAMNSPARVRARYEATADQYEHQDIRLAVMFRIVDGDPAFATEFPEWVVVLRPKPPPEKGASW
jgi:hypothetical protein